MASRASKIRKRARKAARRARHTVPSVGPTTPPGVPVPPGGSYAMTAPNALPLQPSPYGCGAALGWPALLQALSVMAQTQRWAYSLDGNSEIKPLTAYPQLHMHNTAGSLQTAIRLALRGSGGYDELTATAPAVPIADLTVTLAAIRSFGVRIGLTNTITAFRFAVYRINVLDTAVLQTEFNVKVPRIPMDILVLSVSNVNGTMTITELAVPRVTVVFASSPALAGGDTLSVATLTMRDLGMPPNALLAGGLS